MSHEIEYTGKIKKDIKLAKKRGLDFSLFKEVVIQLEATGKLPPNSNPIFLKATTKVFGNVTFNLTGS